MRPLRDGEELRDRAEVLLGRVDREVLVGLVHLAVDGLRDHLRLADGELEALTAHLLDEDRERELATALHLPGVGTTDVEHLQRDVADELAVEAVLHHARRELVALDLADDRRRVRADRHRDGGVVDVDRRQRPHVVGVGERLADGDLLDARDGDDVTGAGLLGGEAVEGLRLQQLGDAHVRVRAVVTHPGDRLALLDAAVEDAQQCEATEERRRVEVRHPRLERRLVVVRRGGNVLQDGLEERLEVVAVGQAAVLGLTVEARPALPEA